MKIGLVCPYNIIAGGGVQECVFALRDEYIKRGHEVHIMSPMPRDYTGEPPEGVIFVGKAAEVKSFHTTAQVSASAENDAIERVLEKYLFDVLHFHEPWVPFVSRQILTRSNACNIATFHAKLPDSRMNRTIERVITPYASSILNYLDAFSAVSEPATDYVRSLTDRHIELIPNGIDLQKYKSASSPKPSKKNKSILFVGRLERRKGVAYLLEAFSLLQHKYGDDISLEIAGAGPDEKRLKRYVDNRAIRNVTFHGYVSEQKKLELMEGSTVFCSPAPYGESFGIVLLEAMSLGTPVVAADNAGYSSVLKERGAISIVNPKNAVAFAHRLDAFMHDEQLRDMWKEWALSYVKQFSYDVIAEKYLKLYEAACEQKQKREKSQ